MAAGHSRFPIRSPADLHDTRRSVRLPDVSTPSEAYQGALRGQWQRLAETGTWWSGPERVAIAAEARLASKRLPPRGVLASAATEAARTVAVNASAIRPETIARWAAEGLDGFAYVEIVGIVSIVMALDVAGFGLGLDEEPLPLGLAGEPSRVRPVGAEITNGWVPTVGPAGAPEALSAVTAERDAMNMIHGPLYLTPDQMGDLEIVRDGMTRPQIELVAARTSMLNNCLY